MRANKAKLQQKTEKKKKNIIKSEKLIVFYFYLPIHGTGFCPLLKADADVSMKTS